MTPTFSHIQDAAGVEAELLVVFAADFAARREGVEASAEPKLLGAGKTAEQATDAVLRSGEYKAAANEIVLLHAPAAFAARRLLIAGVGAKASADGQALRLAAGAAVRYAKARGLRKVTILLPEGVADAGRAVVEGALVADFDPDTYRSDRKDTSLEALTVLGTDTASEAAVREGSLLGEAQNFARGLINEPGNVLTPTVLAQRAEAMCREQGVACEVFSTDKLRELGMGAFLGVTQGSDEPPALIVMRYEPEGAPADVTLGLVGKGITFDTGGISIKPADSMEKMKYDMAGAATMLGAIQAIAALGLKVRVLGVVCSAENMPSGRAYKPGDVLRAMSGKTIEVINTDAEGRLVLADGLHYAKQLGATHLIDAATLTGAISVALGPHNIGAFANNDEIWAHFTDGTKATGEKFWRMPLGPGYRDQIRSHIADLMNTGGRYGGASTAAAFLEAFAGETPWIHLDIAGTAWLDDAKAWMSKGPSGVAVRSVVEWARSYAR